MAFDREWPLVDTTLEFVELIREGSPMEVFAVDPAELPSVNGAEVPDHGAFVARVLPPESTSGPRAGLPDPARRPRRRRDASSSADGPAADAHRFTPVWCRDADGRTVVVPRAQPGALRDHESSLIPLTDDWFVLGLRFEVDAEVRQIFNLQGFHALARRHIRCFVIPAPDDHAARVLVTTSTANLAPAVERLPIFDAAEPPALDLLRAHVEGPVAPPFPSTVDPVEHTETTATVDASTASSASAASAASSGGSSSPRARCASGLFPHQTRTVRWMSSVERGSADVDERDEPADVDERDERDGDDEYDAARPVVFAGRAMYPTGLEHRVGEDPSKGDATGGRRGGRHETARAIGAALAKAVGGGGGDAVAAATAAAKADPPPPLPRGGLLAHPVGAGKTVIVAAYLARDHAERTRAREGEGDDEARRDRGVGNPRDDDPRRDDNPRRVRSRSPSPSGRSPSPSRPSRWSATTLVLCPRQVAGQWLGALREWAPNLRCRRVDARDVDEEKYASVSSAAGGASTGASTGSSTGTAAARRNPDNYPDWSPLRDDAEWDVIVAAYEDVPTPAAPGSRDPVVSPSIDRDRDLDLDSSSRRHPLWTYRESADPTPTRWRRVVFDEPQELDYARRPGARRGAGAWLTDAFATDHRWALTATPGTGDALRDVASLLHGARLSRAAYRRARARWTTRRCRRDPPDACLPAPASIRVAEPVTLTWHEASTVQLYAEAFDATFADVVKMCSGFAREDDDAGAAAALAARADDSDDDSDGIVGDDGPNRRIVASFSASATSASATSTSSTTSTSSARLAGETFESMEAWASRRAAAHESSLAALESRRDALAAALRATERDQAAALAAAGGYNPFEQLDDVMTAEALLDDADADADGGGGDAADDWDGGGGAFDLDALRERIGESMRAAAAAEIAAVADVSDVLVASRDDASPGRASRREDASVVANLVGSLDGSGMDPLRALRAALDDANARVDAARRNASFVRAAAARIRDPAAECSVCLDRLAGKDVTVLRCLHAFDARCVAKLLVARGVAGGNRGGCYAGSARVVTCPLCRTDTRRANMCTFAHAATVRVPASAADEAEQKVNRRSSRGAKVTALTSLLRRVLAADPEEKIVVFAQWPETVAAVAAAVAEAVADADDADRERDANGLGLGALTLLGGASSRAEAVERFQSEAPGTPRVLCLSYAHHAAGLNLHRANHVVIAHPYAAATLSPRAADWSPLADAAAYERQAVGRVLRYPQRRTCRVYRMYALGTVEEELYAAWGWI